ncbi:MAG: hypothetical protein ACQSGP_00795, partial [Frankia sp.]
RESGRRASDRGRHGSARSASASGRPAAGRGSHRSAEAANLPDLDPKAARTPAPTPTQKPAAAAADLPTGLHARSGSRRRSPSSRFDAPALPDTEGQVPPDGLEGQRRRDHDFSAPGGSGGSRSDLTGVREVEGTVDPDPAPAPVERANHGAAAQPAGAGAGYAAALVGGLITSGGAFATWSTLTTTADRRAFSGFAVGDGRFTLLLGLVLVAIGAAGLAHRPFARAPGPLTTVVAALVVGLSAGDIAAGPPVLSSFRQLSGNTVAITSGPGLTATVVGGIVAVIGGLLLLRSRRAADR